ncbi:MAG: hypothetical protein WC454_06370 [Phycisphaerae bacterium]|jgi:DNA-damage-inducible protein D
MVELESGSQRRSFEAFIEKTTTACEHSEHAFRDHFPDIRKMVDVGSDAKREIINV